MLLDSAAFAPTNRLDLATVKPDFVPLSFYKMFGYPTGTGALLARCDALGELRRPWFAGGTITMASVQGDDWYHLAPGHAGFEDGTVDYLGLPAVTMGLKHLSAVGIDSIHARVTALAGWLLEADGFAAPLERRADRAHLRPDRYGRAGRHRSRSTCSIRRGAIYDVHVMERLAAAENISVRTGCFCNPGDGEIAHNITRDEMAECFVDKRKPVTFEECTDLIRDASGKMPNTMRASLGIASNFADVWRLSGVRRAVPRRRRPSEVGVLESSPSGRNATPQPVPVCVAMTEPVS